MKEGGPKASSSTDDDGSLPDQVNILALYNRLEGFPESVQATACSENVKVTVKSIDLTDAEAMKDLGTSLQDDTITATVVVHTAAMSSPRLCQQDPDKARAINVPTHFFEAVANYPMIALSTDQVYDGKQTSGSLSLYKESEQDALKPANAYGQSKLDMEQYLIQQRREHGSVPLFLLRSSIILGPPAPFGGAHSTFFDFCQSQGAKQEATTFFTNEYRTVVSTKYVVQVIVDMILYCMARPDVNANSKPPVYNMGGPFRVNRWDMAKAVFDHFQYDPKLVLEAEQTSSESPLDISMDSSLLQQMGFGGSQHEPGTLEGLVKYVFS
jgi:dTDP-4-dehydrorhamnose reductase